MQKRTTQSRDDVLRAFFDAGEAPSADLLREFIAKYPAYAADLTDFALAWYLDRGESPEDVSDIHVDNALVDRAMSNLQELVYQLDKSADVESGRKEVPSPDPFGGFAPDDYSALWSELGLGSLLGAKLVRRLVDVPEKLLVDLAARLRCGADTLREYFSGPPMLMAENYRSDTKPATTREKEPFEHAIATSNLSEQQKRTLLARYG